MTARDRLRVLSDAVVFTLGALLGLVVARAGRR